MCAFFLYASLQKERHHSEWVGVKVKKSLVRDLR